ncbi:MAG: ArsA family ATPase [Planctomycetes bacterium]|nr:ArsA family ATPase [Planctomycetota bacterium]
MTIPSFLTLDHAQLLLFGGKGGVGKTTCALATALWLADEAPGESFLLVSTDPAHSLKDGLADSPVPHNLTVLEMDVQDAAKAFKAKYCPQLQEIAARGTFFDDHDIRTFLDLPLPGLDELMAFLEIARWVKERTHDCVVVDTAPTGHTLRLLAMPEFLRKWLRALDTLMAKDRYLRQVYQRSFGSDQLEDFLEELSRSVSHMERLLRDRARCRFVPVMLSESLSIDETEKLVEELKRRKVPIAEIVVNRLYPENPCSVCSGERELQRHTLMRLRASSPLASYSLWGIPLYPEEVRGRKALEALWKGRINLSDSLPGPAQVTARPSERVETPAPCPSPETTLLVFAGKGGVGKTTLACATALRLAHERPEKRFLILSTDPAHSLSACLDRSVGPMPSAVAVGLAAMAVDAPSAFRKLKREYAGELQAFFQSSFTQLDIPYDRQVLERILDLSPPGLDEVMALTQVMGLLRQQAYDVLIVDSAPTGHLIRLLELPEILDQWLKMIFELFTKYRLIPRLPGLSQHLVEISKDLKSMRSLLSDPARSALYAVAIPTEMAFQETDDLVAACRRTGIHVPILFLNLVTPLSACPLCAALNRRESMVRAKFQRTFSALHQTIVYHQGDLRGVEKLGDLGKELYETPRGPNGHSPLPPQGNPLFTGSLQGSKT